MPSIDDLYKPLGAWKLTEYISAETRGMGGQHMAPGSLNALIDGTGYVRASRGPKLLAGELGSQLLFLADGNYAGLGNATGPINGSIYGARKLLIYIGSGQVNYAGAVLTGAIATSTLSYIKKSGGVYDGADALQAGHAQPSPLILTPKAVPSAGLDGMAAAIAMVCWRISEGDNQPSLMSLPSNVLILNGESVIAQVPLPDANGQTHWGFAGPKPGFLDLGVFYNIPTSLHGIVSEAELSYSRVVTGATINNATDILDITDPDAADQFTGVDVGRRISVGAFDSWIAEILSPTQVRTNDQNTSGVNQAGDATVTHAIDGITRAVEFSWTAGALLGSQIAPDKAFPPPAGSHSGIMRDTFFLESEGIIYVSEPGFLGSYPPSNAQFPAEDAVTFIKINEGMTARFSQNTFGVLTYVGGQPALQYDELWHNQGIEFAQNVAVGAKGRLMLFLGGIPCVLEAGLAPNLQYAQNVLPDFAGWELQTADKPVCMAYDGLGDYECWFFGKKANVLHVSSNGWCSPQDMTAQIQGNIVSATTFRQKLYFSTSDGVTMRIYQFDAGTGSVMLVQTDDTLETYGDTICEIYLRARVDNTVNPVRIDIIKNFADNNVADAFPILMKAEIPSQVGHYAVRSRERQILNAKTHAMRITMTCTGGDVGFDLAGTKGESSDVIMGRLS